MVVEQRLQIVRKFRVLYLGNVNAFAPMLRQSTLAKDRATIGMKQHAHAFVCQENNGQLVTLDMLSIPALTHVRVFLYQNTPRRF